MDDALLEVGGQAWIPRAELRFRASRSGGPGGQHVNTSSTRVELLWDVRNSPSVSDAQRERILDRLAGRINSEGVLLLAEGGERSQLRNKQALIERFAALLAEALHIPKARKRTRPTRASRERRIQAKKRRSETKRARRSVPPPE